MMNNKPKLTEITNTPKIGKFTKTIPIEETKFCTITRSCDCTENDRQSFEYSSSYDEPESCTVVDESEIQDLDMISSDEIFEKIELDFSDLVYRKDEI